MIVHSGLLFAQNADFGMRYSTNIDFSSNRMNENIVEYASERFLQMLSLGIQYRL